MHVVSVQVGSAQTLQVGTREIETGINKIPAKEIALRIEGVEGDAVVNTRHHGGPDQAVYVYSAEDYAWWEQQLDQSLEPGTFGENLTVSETPDVIRIGDRLIIGAVVLEMTAPRIPCATFATRMGQANWIRRFRDAKRPGFYCRVTEKGTVRPGDRIQWAPALEGNVALHEMVEYFSASDLPAVDMQRTLASPIAGRARAEYEARLNSQVG
ncbi:MAG: MOSC domain-containing protein [Acidimicrobiia bacterium]|nr:MOSC domain-containing protein [Acidimicrobiia bacterium]MDH5616972.1 MOSC domain-containing protein [Acidimicrobiia bacterium]